MQCYCLGSILDIESQARHLTEMPAFEAHSCMPGDQVNDAPQLTAVYSIPSSDLYIQVCERSGNIDLQ